MNFDEQRKWMVDSQLRARGIGSEGVLRAMGAVERHRFVPEELQDHSYEDGPLPIGLGQTISQPYIVAFMTEVLNLSKGMRVLEIGTGSGYQSAVLAELGCVVFSMELKKVHAEGARKILGELGYGSVTIRAGDGYGGWEEEAPFDGIMVTAAPELMPRVLGDQLKEGGRMVVPIGPAGGVQNLMLYTKTEGVLAERPCFPVRFVPMLRGST